MNRSCCESAHSEVKCPPPKAKAYFSWQQLFIQLDSFCPALNKSLIPQVSHSLDDQGGRCGTRTEISVVLLPILGVNPEKWKSLVRHCLYCLCHESLIRPFSSPSEDTETVSNSSEGKCGSPHDLLETIFIRKVGAFVNKPINQVTTSNLLRGHHNTLLLPSAPTPRSKKQPSARATPETDSLFLPAAFAYKVLSEAHFS